MNITKRLFTYPVLSEEKDDYDNSVFDVEEQYGMDGVNYLHFRFIIKMNNPELQHLVDLGEAEYVIHMECSTTAFRTTFYSISEYIECDVPIGRLNGKLDITALIIAKKEIKGFTSTDLNEDFQGITFDFSKGNILGYKNLSSLDIVKNFEEFSNASSIFVIYKRLTTEPKPIDVNIDGPQIKVGLGTNEYDIYSRFCKKPQFQPILNSMIVFPALVYVFEELQQKDGIEFCEDKAWFISLNNAYAKRGIDFVDEINGEKTSVQLAQEAMELPLTSALSMMAELFENDDMDQE